MELWNRSATNRYASWAYDLVVMFVAFFFAVAPDPWVVWSILLLVNAAGLLVFNNRFIKRGVTLVSRWGILLGLMLEVGLWIWLGYYFVHNDPVRLVLATAGFLFVIAVRLCFQPAEAEAAPRKPETSP
ncbi:MAG: hypothetical protein AAGF92_14330 [Myxococcota bacterium]